jgi:hypothetical protein
MVFVRGSYSAPDDAEFPVHPHILDIQRYQAAIDAANPPPSPVAEPRR